MRINLTTPMSDDKERQRRTKAEIDAIERYTEERMADEYGRIHKDGSRSGGQPVVDNAMLETLQKDAGLPHLPTQETYQFRMAVSDEGPLAYQWSDKPHRLLYDACSIIESEAALRTYSNIFDAGDVQKHTLIVEQDYASHTVKVKSLNDSQPTQSDALRITDEMVERARQCAKEHTDADIDWREILTAALGQSK